MDTSEPRTQLRRKIREQWPPLSQARFAERMGIHPSLLARYLSGKRTPPLGFWPAAAAELGCKLSDLMSTPEPTPIEAVA